MPALVAKPTESVAPRWPLRSTSIVAVPALSFTTELATLKAEKLSSSTIVSVATVGEPRCPSPAGPAAVRRSVTVSSPSRNASSRTGTANVRWFSFGPKVIRPDEAV